ncbi:helix-turn-helix domain-containing protein [Metabacillus sp. RGM 3146]|uniref:helix-turn-helix domain-containing protein n=1 Tax=Metabacillus sp. RGM 3146 TaxID=3401092 RepID=UPI003B9CEF05
MTYLDLLILYCVHKFQGERSISAVYHLFKGKRSSQTIQDLKLFGLGPLFAIFPGISKKTVEDSREKLLKAGFIADSDSITNSGRDYLSKEWNEHSIPASLNGWKYSAQGRQFWSRLSLFVQTVSNLVGENSRFLPITNNEKDLQWVKHFLLTQKISRKELAASLYDELYSHLSGVSEKEAAVFTYRLSSKNRIGLTTRQLSEYFQTDAAFLELLFKNVLHSLLVKIENGSYSILSHLYQPSSERKTFTASALKTYEMIANGKTIGQIAAARKLKESTIEDHVVEIALNDTDFDLSEFVTAEEMNEMINKILLLQTKQLKKVKESLNHQFSYFQIRLAYAEMRRKNDEKSI